MLYVIEHATTGDVFRAYQGNDEATIAELLSENGFTFDFVSEDAFNTAVAAKAATAPQPTQLQIQQQKRAAAYRAVSDPLVARASRLAMAGDPGADAAKTAALAAVATIQAQYPYPPSCSS